MPALAAIGCVLLALAGLMLFVGLCLGDRWDNESDGKTIFWLLAIGLALVISTGEG